MRMSLFIKTVPSLIGLLCSLVWLGCPYSQLSGAYLGQDVEAQCSNGIQDEGEIDVDCGGPCPSCTDPSCESTADCEGFAKNGQAAICTAGICRLERQQLIKSESPDSVRFGKSLSMSNDWFATTTEIELRERDFNRARISSAYIYQEQPDGVVRRHLIESYDLLPANVRPNDFDRPVFDYYPYINLSMDTQRMAMGVNTGSTDCPGAAVDLDVCDGSGDVFIISFDEDEWVQDTKIRASDTDSADRFGERVILNGSSLAVSAPGQSTCANGVDVNCLHSGAVYVFAEVNGEWVEQQRLSNPVGHDATSFGDEIAFDGETLAIRAPGDTSCLDAEGLLIGGQTEEQCAGGTVFVFQREDSIWEHTETLKSAWQEDGSVFGVHMALEGEYLIISSSDESYCLPSEDSGSCPRAGVVYIYFKSDGRWTLVERLRSPEATEYARFGNGVSLSGDVLLVTDGSDARCEPDGLCDYDARIYRYLLRDGSFQLDRTVIQEDSGGYPLRVDSSSRGFITSNTEDANCGVGIGSQDQTQECPVTGQVQSFFIQQ